MGRRTVEKALDILSLFSISRPRLGISEISEALNLTKPTVHGLVQSLMTRGFVTQDRKTKKYSLGLNIYELGTVLAATLKINQVAAAPAHRLVQDTSMAARIALWDQDTLLVILTLYPNYQSLQFNPPGPRIPAYCSSTGKAVLAALPETELTSYLDRTEFLPYTANTIIDKEQLISDLEGSRHRGYTLDQEEYTLGLFCIGAPIFNEDGYPIAGMSLSGPAEQLLGKDLSRMAKGLMVTARDISVFMGFSEGDQAKRTLSGWKPTQSR